jgi:hypothetical protein
MRAQRRPKNDDRRLEGAFERGGKTHKFFRWLILMDSLPRLKNSQK